MKLIKKILKATFDAIKHRPIVYVPFLIFAILETISFVLICFTPRTPLVTIFGPLIKTLFSEQFLHYPSFFLLVPKLSSFARMTLSVIFGSLLTAMAIILVLDTDHKKQTKLNYSFKLALKKYDAYFLIYLLVTVLFYYSVKVCTSLILNYFIAGHTRLLFLSAKLWLGSLLICVNFVITVLIQSLFIYTLPILIIDKGKLLGSIWKSMVMFKKLFVPTIILVAFPMLLYVPIILLNSNSDFLMNKLFPEFMLIVTFSGILLSSLVIDPLVTISTTYLYLFNKES